MDSHSSAELSSFPALLQLSKPLLHARFDVRATVITCLVSRGWSCEFQMSNRHSCYFLVFVLLGTDTDTDTSPLRQRCCSRAGSFHAPSPPQCYLLRGLI